MAEPLMDIIQRQITFPSNDWSSMLDKFLQNRDDMTDQVIRQKISKQGQSGHYDKAIIILQVFNDSVIHKETQLVTRLDQKGS